MGNMFRPYIHPAKTTKAPELSFEGLRSTPCQACYRLSTAAPRGVLRLNGYPRAIERDMASESLFVKGQTKRVTNRHHDGVELFDRNFKA
jgi:hypothetical protein